MDDASPYAPALEQFKRRRRQFLIFGGLSCVLGLFEFIFGLPAEGNAIIPIYGIAFFIVEPLLFCVFAVLAWRVMTVRCPRCSWLFALNPIFTRCHHCGLAVAERNDSTLPHSQRR